MALVPDKRPKGASSTFCQGLSIIEAEPDRVPVGGIINVESIWAHAPAPRCLTSTVCAQETIYSLLTAYYLVRSRQSTINRIMGLEDRPMVDLDDPDMSIKISMGLRTGTLTGGSGKPPYGNDTYLPIPIKPWQC